MTLGIHYTLLTKVAETLEIRFLSPIYLVGSFPEKYKDALDIDIIMVVTKNRLERICGPVGEPMHWERRRRFMKKQKLFFEETITDFDIDFKVQTEEEFKRYEQSGKKSVKLGLYVMSPQ